MNNMQGSIEQVKQHKAERHNIAFTLEQIVMMINSSSSLQLLGPVPGSRSPLTSSGTS